MLQIVSYRRGPARQIFPRHADQAGRAFAGLAGAMWRGLLMIRRRHRDETLLRALSDHQLRDLGISRGEISRVVHRGRDW